MIKNVVANFVSEVDLEALTCQMVRELNVYTGREQQMKGAVTANTQLAVFGTVLPRGHGHRGRLSGYVRNVFYYVNDRWLSSSMRLLAALPENANFPL